MSCLGAIASFYFARYYGHAWVERKLERFPLVMQFSKRMEKRGFLYVLLGRLIPILPSSAINFAAGLTRMRFTHFLWGTLLGKFPIVFLESMIAHDLFHFHKYKGRLLVAGYICSFDSYRKQCEESACSEDEIKGFWRMQEIF